MFFLARSIYSVLNHGVTPRKGPSEEARVGSCLNAREQLVDGFQGSRLFNRECAKVVSLELNDQAELAVVGCRDDVIVYFFDECLNLDVGSVGCDVEKFGG